VPPARRRLLPQVDTFVGALPANLPSAACCTAASGFLGKTCQCDSTVLGTLPGFGISANGLNGALAVVRRVCNLMSVKLDCPKP
jgi:hypothetical protein